MDVATKVTATRIEATSQDDTEMRATEVEVPPVVRKGGRGTGRKSSGVIIFSLMITTVAVVVTVLVASSYTSSSDASPTYDDSPVQLVSFESCNHLSSTLQLRPSYSAGAEVSLSDRYSPSMDMSDMGLAESSPSASLGGSGASSRSAAAEYSRTNVQVSGIDESDLVKNDGEHIFSVGGRELVILRAYPASARAVVSRTDISVGIDDADLFAAVRACPEDIRTAS